MSERPIPYQWAVVNTTYGAGGDPWDGQPTTSAPAADVWTPKTGLAAEELNYVVNRVTSDVTNLGNFVGLDASLNWPKGLVAATYAGLAHDPVNGRWMGWLGTAGLNAFYNDIAGYTAFVTGLASNVQLAIADTTTGNIFVLESTTKIAIVTPAGVATESTGPAIVANPAAQGTFFAGRFVYWAVTSGTSIGAWYSPAAGTSFTAATAPGGGYPSGATTWRGYFAKSASTLLAFPGFSATAMSTADGITWTAITLPMVGSEVVVGAGYSANESLFYICLETVSGAALGGSSRVLTSATGATGSWTVASTWAHDIISFAVHGSELCGIAYLNGVFRIVSSVDKGAHWGLGRIGPVVGSHSSFVTNGTLYMGGNQFAVIDGTNTALSQASGPSQAIV